MNVLAQMTPEQAGDWLSLWEKYGFAAVCFIVLCGLVVLGIAKVSKWLSTKVIEPLTARHIQFLDQTEKCITSQAESISGLRIDIREIRELQQQHIEVCRKSAEPQRPHKPALGNA